MENTQDGTRRIEVHREILDGQVLLPRTSHLCADRGSKSWPGLAWLMSKKNIYGSLWGDPLHDDWNGLQSAAAEASVWLAWLERAATLNMPFGPWWKDSFFQDLKNNGTTILSELSTDDRVFQTLYKRAATEMDMLNCETFGTMEHKQAVLDKLRTSRFLTRRGRKVRMGRWFSLPDRNAERRGELMPTLVVLIHVGVRRGFWKTLDESPLFASDEPKVNCQAERVPAVAAAAEASRVASQSKKETVASSNRQLQNLQKDSQNKLDFVAKILSNEKNFFIQEGSLHIVEPTRLSFGKWRKMQRTKKGTFEVHTQWALEFEQSWYCSLTFQQLRGGEGFQRLGFSSIAGDAASEEMDIVVARHMYRFASALCGYRLANKLQFRRSLPGVAILLLHWDEEIVQKTLLRLAEIFEHITAMEKIEHDSTAAQWLKAFPWRTWAWVRSLLVRLSECDFKAVPADVKEELNQCFQGLMSTDLVENGFQVLTNAMSANAGNKCSRVERWRNLRQAPLLEDFDRRPLPLTTASRSISGSKLPPTAFDADSRDFSLGGMESLQDITNDVSWFSPSAHVWRTQGFAIEAMRATQTMGVQTLHRCWNSLLLPAPCGVFPC